MAAVEQVDLASPGAAAPSSAAEAKAEEGKLELTPGKEVEAFRVYNAARGEWDAGVYEHYKQMRTNQSVDFVTRMEAKWLAFDKAEMTIAEAFAKLGSFVDRSDPDITLPNKLHGLQTAEAIRRAGKPDWMVLVGLIHDMGKITFAWGSEEDGMSGRADGPQWALGGDTWVVGCRIPDTAVYPELNALNPDMADGRYNTENGMYTPGCGIMNLKFAWGHDEYMYRLLVANGVAANFPPEALAMLRLHSCYPWHRGGAYRSLMAPGDEKLLAAVLEFNQFDLYTKSDATPDEAALWPYYQSLIDRYCPGKLKW